MQKDIEQIRFVLDEHLTAINENTAEIQSLFDYLQEVETKVDALNKRLDELQLVQVPLQQSGITPLNQVEKKVFLTLYTEETPLAYQEIAERSQVPLAMVPEAITSLHKKGIAFIRTYCNNHMLLRMDPLFKERQAKENVVNLSLQSFLE